MVGDVLLATEFVFTVKAAVFAFAATMTLVGTVAVVVSLLRSVMRAPPVGAGAFSVTVPLVDDPPCTEAGFRLTLLNTGDNTVRVADWFVLL